jgi:hypothetical protein
MQTSIYILPAHQTMQYPTKLLFLVMILQINIYITVKNTIMVMWCAGNSIYCTACLLLNNVN